VSEIQVPGIGVRGSGLELTPNPEPRTPTKSFGETLRESIAEVNKLQQVAEAQAKDLALGKTKDVAQTLIAIEKANISFQLMLQVRNKLVEAYQEVMRTQM
jgi:flagellar hook-basal body complex protein FliE